jgi:hypothetical protein
VSGTVLADTGPLYAAADPSDDHHERAQGDIRRLNSEGVVDVHISVGSSCRRSTWALLKAASEVTSEGL